MSKLRKDEPGVHIPACFFVQLRGFHPRLGRAWRRAARNATVWSVRATLGTHSCTRPFSVRASWWAAAWKLLSATDALSYRVVLVLR